MPNKGITTEVLRCQIILSGMVFTLTGEVRITMIDEIGKFMVYFSIDLMGKQSISFQKLTSLGRIWAIINTIILIKRAVSCCTEQI